MFNITMRIQYNEEYYILRWEFNIMMSITYNDEYSKEWSEFRITRVQQIDKNPIKWFNIGMSIQYTVKNSTYL